MARGRKFVGRLKLCCAITSVLIILILVACIILYFTILKPKEPKLTTQAVTLEYIKLVPIPFHLNVSLGIAVTIDNRNYGSFKYKNSTAYVNYRGRPAAEAPIQEDTIPARGKHNVSTTAVVLADNLISDNPYFWLDFATGCLNFTSSTTLHGIATVFKIFKIKATTYGTCDISVFIKFQNASSVCSSKIKY